MARYRRPVPLAFSLILFLAPAAAGASSAVRASGNADLVIYNNDLALVRQPCRLSLSRGKSDVTLEGVPRRIDSTSVRLQGEGFRVSRQTFHYDLWSGDRVFRRFLGDSIFYRYGGRAYRGRLAGIEGDDLFIERRDSVGVLTMLKRSQITEIEFPARLALATRPSLSWEVESAKGGDISAVVSYLTAGIHWSAEYSAALDAGEQSVELSGWAVIVNRSGTSYSGANVSLVAGELHRAGETPERGPSAEEAPPKAPEQGPVDLFAYHLYRIAGPIDLDHLETVQAPLVGPVRVPVRRAYIYDGARDGSKVRVRVEFGNEKGRGLGTPLPAGRVRLYAADPSGARTLAGDDAIGHTAADEKIKILSGIAFDLVGDRTRLSHTRVTRNVTEDQYKITIRNRGAKPATVTIIETLYGNWEITAKSSDYRKREADTVEFDLEIGAGQTSAVTYTARFTY